MVIERTETRAVHSACRLCCQARVEASSGVLEPTLPGKPGAVFCATTPDAELVLCCSKQCLLESFGLNEESRMAEAILQLQSASLFGFHLI